MVRIECETRRQVPRSMRTTRTRMGCPLVVANYQCRAHANARISWHGGPHRVQRIRFRRPRRCRLPAICLREQRGCRCWSFGVHTVAHPGRWIPWRPHHHASWSRTLPCYHRRIRRWTRQVLVQEVHANRWLRHIHRHEPSALHHWRMGTKCRKDHGQGNTNHRCRRQVDSIRCVASKLPIRIGTRCTD